MIEIIDGKNEDIILDHREILDFMNNIRWGIFWGMTKNPSKLIKILEKCREQNKE